MTKRTDVTFARAVIVLATIALAAIVPLITEGHRFAFAWNVLAWGVLALVGVGLWF